MKRKYLSLLLAALLIVTAGCSASGGTPQPAASATLYEGALPLATPME